MRVGPVPATNNSKARGSRSIAKHKPAPKTTSDSGEAALDVVAIANDVKENPDYSIYFQKVLSQKDVWRKIQFVLWYADEPLTSGEVARVLEALDTKADLPGVSRKLKTHSSELLTDGVRKAGSTVKYRLTSTSKQELEGFLNLPA